MPGTWTPLTNQPTFPASTMLLLTDGTVLSQESGGKRWWRLWPDQHGNYINGTWSPQADMANTRLYYASAVLNDGRVFVAGGEYSDAGGDTNKAEIFNPVIDAWSALAAPAGWNNIGDAPCAVLPDGRLTLAPMHGLPDRIKTTPARRKPGHCFQTKRSLPPSAVNIPRPRNTLPRPING
jgi:hypothetical protein